ncbi:alpha-ketoglutarate dehydrogenase component 4-like [Crassostrea angulata]|uniref:alpha-ketoglutarate dehydrogenase component 4-like n=1 Tax=Magallana angulata TaxID=2784310 RepID=UPI0022B0E468|nr:alpha-ketoglutarate dehydrogenase component 4-like [Crassostrea angulata]
MAARTFQTVRPHVPLIKFRGGNITKDTPAVMTPATKGKSETAPSTPQTTKIATPGSILEHHQLPKKYARTPLSIEEMEYIQRGGPDVL